jgi:TolA-binding protein
LIDAVRALFTRPWFGIVLLVFVVSACGVGADGQSIFERGERALSRGDYEVAVEAYTELFNSYPESPLAAESIYKRAYVYKNMLGDNRRAMDSYATLLDLYPNSEQVYTAREDIAAIHSSMNEDRLAIAEYAWLIENAPSDKHSGYRYEIAMKYVKRNDFDQARIEFEELLKSSPSEDFTPKAYYQIATTYYLEGRLEDAIKGYDIVIGNFIDDPLHIEARFSKAVALEELGRLKEALTLFKELRGESASSELLKIRIDATEARIKEGPGIKKRRR